MQNARARLRSLPKTLLLCVLALCLTCCSGKNGGGKISAPPQSMRDTVTGEFDPITGTTSLTGIYRPAETYGFEGERLSRSSYPLYDGETGSLTAFSTFEDLVPMTDENGDPVYVQPDTQGIELVYTTTLRTLLPDGTCADAVELPMPEGHRFYKGGIAENGVWYITYNMSAAANDPDRYALNRTERDGGEHRSIPGSAIFANPADAENLTRIEAALFPDGTLAAGLGIEVAVLDRDLNRLYSVAADGEIEKLAALEDGGIRVLTGPSQERKLWTLGAGEDRLTLFAYLNGSTNHIFFGPGADYYGLDREGIYAVRGEETVRLLNRQNSGLSGTVFPIEAAAPEVFVLDVISDTGEDDPSISLYRRSEDIDLSSVKVIEIATTLFSISQELELKISKYNREHPETRVVVTVAADGNVPFEERHDRLCFSLANGFYKPDILLSNNNTKVIDTVLSFFA